MGLDQHPLSPCIFSGKLISDQPPIYVSVYVDNIIYFSQSRKVEELFESKFTDVIDIEFNGQISYFLGVNCSYISHEDSHKSIHVSQEAFIESLARLAKLTNPHMVFPKPHIVAGIQ